MSPDRLVTSAWAQKLTLLTLRVTTGFLLVWVGLNKIVTGNVPFMIRDVAGLDGVVRTAASLGAGAGEVLIGALCVAGLWRKLLLPLQAAINGATAASVWWAIVDPYRWYISGVDRIVFNSHVFYPTSITFAACLLLIAFRPQDAWALDNLRWRGAAGR